MRGSFVQNGDVDKGNFTYEVPIKEGTIVRETLAEIREQAAESFFWYRKPSDKFPDWIGTVGGEPVQGMEVSLELAKMRVLEGWRV